MSDQWITLVPENPRFVPDPAGQSRARERFATMTPRADGVAIKVCEAVEFFDCGANFERILCPSCGAEIAVDWWQERMSEDYDQGFRLATYSTTCCATPHRLDEFTYEWPQAFGRFALAAMNPGIGTLEEGHKEELEQILGTKLRVIYQHL